MAHPKLRVVCTRGQAIGEDVAADDAKVGPADGAGRFDKQAFAHGQRDGAHDPRVLWDVDQADGDHHIHQAEAEQGHHNQGQKEVREGQYDVHRPHDSRVQTPTEVPGHKAEGHSQRHGDSDRQSADAKSDAGAEDDPAQDVSAEFIRPEPKSRRGRLELSGKALVQRIVRSQDRGEEGHRE
jgi:hypothetical protein